MPDKFFSSLPKAACWPHSCMVEFYLQKDFGKFITSGPITFGHLPETQEKSHKRRENRNMRKTGTFFLLLGTFLIMLFLLSDIANSPSFSLLVFGGIFFIGGVLFKIKSPAKSAPSPSTRFQYIKSMKNRPKMSRKEKREAKKQEKAAKKEQKTS